MKKKLFYLIFGFQAITLISCHYFSDKDNGKRGKAIARVYEVYLYEEDLQDVISTSTTGKDSADIVQRFVDSWVKKQISVHEAQNNAEIDLNEIDKRVEEYKHQLLIYAYQKQYIEKNLDTLVTSAQIQAYYQENQKNFELKQNIVKGVLLKVAKQATKLDELRGWLRSDSPDARQEVKSYALSFAEARIISDTSWIDFEEIIVGTPFANNPNRIQLLGQGKVLEASDDGNFYFIKILEYKIADQISPLAYLRDKIVTIIINRRKIELQEKYETDVLQRAEKGGNIEIFGQ
jgi:hypothetical protein